MWPLHLAHVQFHYHQFRDNSGAKLEKQTVVLTVSGKVCTGCEHGLAHHVIDSLHFEMVAHMRCIAIV